MAGQGVKELRDSLEKTWLPSDTEDTSNPSYYKALPKNVEVYEIIETVLNRDLGFTKHVSYSDLGHILRYTLRLGAKNGSLQELKKVQWYLSRIIEREEQLDREQKPKRHAKVSPSTPGAYRGEDFGFKTEPEEKPKPRYFQSWPEDPIEPTEYDVKGAKD